MSSSAISAPSAKLRSTAGPARLIAKPLPRNSPVPIAPPMAIMVMRRALRLRRKPRSRSMISAKPAPRSLTFTTGSLSRCPAFCDANQHSHDTNCRAESVLLSRRRFSGRSAVLGYFRLLTRPQLHAFLAALAGWALDALDFFVFVFCLKSISAEFHTDVKAVSEGIFLTLACRPLGALAFGWLAEKYGRRPILMLNVVSYSAVQLATAFAPNLATLLALRALFGFAMGGEWGVGAALALETLPAKGRGFFSGLLQEGYVLGYLLASVLFATLFDHVGWRGMFIISSASALLVLYIRFGVQESPAWLAGRVPQRATSGAFVWAAVRDYFPTLAYLVLLMACFNAF